MTGIEWLDVFVIVGIVGAGLAVLGRFLSRLWRLVVPLKDFLDDWTGEPARAGSPERPGIPERLARLEQRIDAEFSPNHGTSARDALDRLERAVRRVEDGLAAHLDQHREQHRDERPQQPPQ
ncbi:hypothetical protein ACIBH1_45840 [Nonomuraea sp. NPDC050663]|uniref:hypothetical protein n=1 Tax=Nonomuraea sp. NPDC050663 TaxID=3364370 RepID=UPI0037A541F0